MNHESTKSTNKIIKIKLNAEGKDYQIIGEIQELFKEAAVSVPQFLSPQIGKDPQ